MMAELLQLEYFMLRYVPDVVKGEYVNIGMITFENGVAGAGPVHVRFTRDWRRTRGLNPAVDTRFFEELEQELRHWLNSDLMDCSKGGVAISRRDWIVGILRDSGSNALQLSDAHIVQVVDVGAMLKETFKKMCNSSAWMTEREDTRGRKFIRSRMKQAFQKAEVWPRMNKAIKVSKYVTKGDPLTLDCGYLVETPRAKGLSGIATGTEQLVRFFHAVSLAKNVDAAKVLGYTWQNLRNGIMRVERHTADLTAIVEDDLNRNNEAIDYAMNLMLDNGVNVRPVSQLPEIAEQARRELRQ